MKSNGKNEGDVEIVEGNLTKRSAVLGLRVTGANVKEDKNGGAISEITITGHTKGMVKMLGNSVIVSTAKAGKSFVGKLTDVHIKLGKDDAKIWRTKVAGARDLDGLVGLQVTLEQAQAELPGVEAPDEETHLRDLKPEKLKGRARGKDAAAGPD